MDQDRAYDLMQKSAYYIEELSQKYADAEKELEQLRTENAEVVSQIEMVKVAMSLVEANEQAPYNSLEEMLQKAASYAMNIQKEAASDAVVLNDKYKQQVPSMGKVAERPSMVKASGQKAMDRFIRMTNSIYHNEE